MAATTLVSSAARTVTGSSSAIAVGSGAANVELEVEVTAVSGTSPTLALTVQWSDDGTNFGNVDGATDSFASITATGNVVKQMPVRAPYMQFTWTLGGTTPSFTFSIIDTASNVI